LRWRTALLIGAVIFPFVLALITTAPANAHAVLVASDPIDGARLAAAPTQVTLTFDESVRPVASATQVITDTGDRVDTGLSIADDGARVVLTLPAKLPVGSYTATWKVISADSHEVAGAISFGIGRDARSTAAPLTHSHETDDLATKVARGALFVGLVLALGVGLMCALLWPETLSLTATKALCGVGAFLLVAGSEIQLTAHIGDHDGAAPDTRITLARIVIALLLVGIGMGIFRKATPVLIVVGAACGVALAVTIAIDGHGGVGADATLATIATTAHLVAMATWVGGLIAIGAIALPSLEAGGLQRWSQIAFSCVCVLVLTGVYQAWRQVNPVQALWSTDYGIVLCAKAAGVTAMLALAVWARRRLATPRLRRAVALEAGMGIIVLVVTTVLVSLPPARTTYGPAVALSAPLRADTYVAVDIAATRRGPLTIHAAVRDGHGQPVPVESIAGTLSSSDAHIPSLPVDFATAGQNQWQSIYATTPRAGEWALRLTVRFGPTDAVVSSVKFHVW